MVNDYITAAGAVVMGWVWGSEDPGHWIELTPQEGDPGQFYINLTISNTYTGIIIYRFIPGSENKPYNNCTDFFVNGDEHPYVKEVENLY